MKITLIGLNEKQVINKMINIIKLTFVIFLTLTFQSLAVIQAEESVIIASATKVILFEEDDKFLHVDEAFVISSDLLDGEFIIRWKIAENYYLYKHRFSFSAAGVDLSEAYIPDGIKKVDEYFGAVEVYYKHVEVSIPYKNPQSRVVLTVNYQGCADAGLCYTPATRHLEFELQANGQLKQISGFVSKITGFAIPNQQDQKQKTVVPASEKSSSVSKKIASEGMFWTLLGFFGAGLLLTFTPCVLPMIPILSSIIAGQGKGITTGKAFRLSLVYVQAMAITYAILGILVAKAGSSLSGYLQSPLILGVVAVVFILLSLSMFGLFELKLPGFIQNRVQGISEKQTGGNYIGVAIMGVISTLIVSPCTTAPLTAALLIIANSGDVWLGGWSLYFLGVGMGIPLLIIGVSQGRLVPKVGPWMVKIKQLFGFVMLGMALYITGYLMPGSLALFLWAGLFIIAASVFGAFESATSTSQAVIKGFAIILFLMGLVYLVGAAMGNERPSRPLAGLMTGQGAGNKVPHLAFKNFSNLAELNKNLAQAKQAGRPVMIDFFAEWCVACYEFEDYTFSNAAVVNIIDINNVLLLQADVTANNEQDLALLKQLKVTGLPTIIFINQAGEELVEMRTTGFEDAETFAKRLTQVYQ
ncbi:MAG: protein-disulfide reductase DsbD [Gammaproteobacteria bacterium]|nr:MAG: protein-disulfide reductase DsbD [Gammaproteobacteria bacterium]